MEEAEGPPVRVDADLSEPAVRPARERTRRRLGPRREMLPEVGRFGVSGAVAYVAEVGVFNVCLALGVAVTVASLVGATAGTAVAYAGNRFWTYRGRPSGDSGRRIALFCAVNVAGAAITTGCVVFSHHLLHLTSVLDDNVAKNVVGMGVAMVFRFFAYRTWVFPARPPKAAGSLAVGRSRSVTRGRAGAWRSAFTAAVPPWLVAHGLVLLALGIAWWVYGGLPHTGAVRPAAGLLVWDSGWYRALAVDGYGPHGPAAVRFFPLLPLLVRAASVVSMLPVTAVLLGVCSVCALAYGAVLHVLTCEETADPRAARRAVWLSQLAPGTAVLVLGYTEALAGMLAVAFFLFLRRGNVLPAVLAGVFSGLTRPTGLLLAVPAAVELLRARSAGRRLGAGLSGLSPLVGTLIYLGWCALAGHGWLTPYTVQTRPGLRGGLIGNPFQDLLHPHHGQAMAVFVLVISLLGMAVAVALLCVSGRRLPAAYTAWALAMVAAAATATGWRSLPRYLTEVFPLLIAAALLTRTRTRSVLVVGGGCLLFTALAVLGFGGRYVP